MTELNTAVIVSAVRTPVGRAHRGSLKHTRPDDLAAVAIREAVARANVPPELVEDVLLGCATPEAEQGANVARIAALRSGLPHSAAAATVNRFCASGLETIARAAERIMCGFGEVAVAGGVESMSAIPMGGHQVLPNPTLMESAPDTYLSMGLTAENLVERHKISRAEQDAFALTSHERAIAALDAGRFAEETVAVTVRETVTKDGRPVVREREFDADEGPRRETSAAALAALKPVFHPQGTVTAGNSSQMSDGAAAVVLMSEARARTLGIRPIGRFVAYAVAGVPPEIMGIGPVAAIPRALKLARLRMADIALIELNEAFAAQALAVIKEADLPTDRLNVNGGAIALGHPLGCTGAKLTVSLLHELHRRGGRYGIVTMCVGGGMGGAAIFEAL
jgi:acetyl-CoA acyltransferase